GGSVVELHAYAVDGPADPDSAHGKTVRDALLGDMYLVYPESRGMTIVAEEYLLDDDCGLADISPWDDHPAAITGIPNPVDAGARIRSELPVALMERSATTGVQAANAPLADRQVTGHDLDPPPRQGPLRRSAPGRLLRRFALPEGTAHRLRTSTV